jgi:hypothetical protein
MRWGLVEVWSWKEGKVLAALDLEPKTGDSEIAAIASPAGDDILVRTESRELLWSWKAGSTKELTSDQSQTLETEWKRAQTASRGSAGEARLTVERERDRLTLRDKKAGRLLPTGWHQPADYKFMWTLSPDEKHLAAALPNGDVRILPVNDDSRSLAMRAQLAMPRCLSVAERLDAFLEPAPPSWCITGPGLEDEPDSAKWRPKPPYATPAWNSWLINQRSGRNVPLPTR